MKLERIKTDERLDHDPMLASILKQGIRSECLFHTPAFYLIIKPTKIMDAMYRLFWEDNYLHVRPNAKSGFTIDEAGEVTFHMCLSLAETIDFIYEATPPILRNQIPDNIKSGKQIKGLMETLLMEESIRKETYLSILKKMTKYAWYEKPNVMDFTKIRMLRDQTPTGLICQIIYSDKPLSILRGNNMEMIHDGVFLLHANNNDDLKQLLITHGPNLHFDYVCDVHKDSTGSYIMLQSTTAVFNQLVTKTYAPFVK